jgi:hypothetical protein
MSLWWAVRFHSDNKVIFISRFVVTFLFGLSPSLPFLLPYLDVLKAFGDRGYWEPHAFQATIASFLSFGSFNFLYSKIFNLSHSEASLGTGIFIPLLALISFYCSATHKKIIKYKYIFTVFLSLFIASTLIPDFYWILNSTLSWLTLISLILLGLVVVKIVKKTDQITIISNQELILLFSSLAFIFMAISFGPISRPDIASYSPYYFLYNFIPGFSGFRAISRAGIVSIYLFSLIAFYWLAIFQAKREKILICCLCCCFIFLENISAVFPFEPSSNILSARNISSNQSKSSALGVLIPYGDTQSEDGGIKSFFNFATMQNQFLLWSVENNLKSINGFTGIKTRLVKELPQKLSSFPDEKSLRTLSEIIDLNTILVTSSYSSNSKLFSTDNLNLYKDFLTNKVELEDGSFQFSFHPRIKISNSELSSLIVQSNVKMVTCNFASPLQPDSSISAILAHTLENIPTVVKDNGVLFTLPKALKTVPFVTIKLKSSSSEDNILTDCKSIY